MSYNNNKEDAILYNIRSYIAIIIFKHLLSVCQLYRINTIMYLVAGVLLLFGSVITAGTCTSGNWTYLKPCDDISNCSILLEIGECVTCNPTTCATELGICRLTLEPNEKDGFIVFHRHSNYLVSACTCEELNERVCGPFNQEGLLCSKCKPGYGPAPYSWSLKCVECHDEHVGWFWLLYLLLELVPLTVFYLIVILLNIHVTSPPFTAFVFFCQLFTLLQCVFQRWCDTI